MGLEYRPKQRSYRGRSHYGDYQEFELFKSQVDREIEEDRERRQNERNAARQSEHTNYRERDGQMNRKHIRGDHSGQHDFYDPKTYRSGSAGSKARRTRDDD
jgi:hypothetical protein